MINFKVGDKVSVIGDRLYGTTVLKTHVLTISTIGNDGWCGFEETNYWFPITKLELVQSPKNQVIDQMNEERQNVAMTTETPVCYHDWHDILLFTSTVTECRKCGVLRD